MRTGLQTGFGFIRSSLGRILLEDLDFRTAASVGVNGSGSFSSSLATDEWSLTSAIAGVYPNSSQTGGTGLTSNGGNGLEDRFCGAFNGTDFETIKAWEVRPTAGSGTDYLYASGDSSSLDSDEEDLCVVVVFRAPTQAGVTTIASKRGAVGESYAGWQIEWAGNGAVRVNVDDGPSNYGPSKIANHADGALHWLKFFYNQTTKQLSVVTDLVSESVGASGLTLSMTNSANLEVGRWTGGSSAPSPNTQVVHIGGAVGANAAAMYAQDIVLPGAATAISSPTRNCTISGRCSANRVIHYGVNKLPLFFDEAEADGAGGLALHPNSARTNLNPHSETITSWLHQNCTSVANDGDANDGFKYADSVTALANSGSVRRQTIPVATSTLYTASFRVKRNGLSDVGGILRMYDDVGATFHDTPFTATADWQLVSVTFTSNVAATFVRHYCQLNLSGESVFMTQAQVNPGGHRGTYIRTTGAARTLVASAYQDAIDIKPSSGEIEFDFIPRSTGAITVPYRSGVGSPDRRDLQQAASGAVFSSVHNDSGAGEGAFSYPGGWALDVDNHHRLLWDSIVGVDGREAVTFLNGVRSNGDVFPWEGTATPGVISDTLRIGSSGVSYALDGSISRIRIYDAPGALA